MDPAILTSLFGNQMARGQQLETSKGDVSQMSTALKGPGGPFDDMIPAVINNSDGSKQAAALSPGEFVLSNPIVSFLGDGDVDMGAGLLDIMQKNPDALAEVKDVLRKYAGA